MSGYLLTETADQDLAEICAYIARDNVLAADRLLDEILHACERLARRPDLGHRRPDLTDDNVLFFPVRGVYLVIYKPETKPLQIARIVHGAREIADFLTE